jgi:hypothetical protein
MGSKEKNKIHDEYQRAVCNDSVELIIIFYYFFLIKKNLI